MSARTPPPVSLEREFPVDQLDTTLRTVQRRRWREVRPGVREPAPFGTAVIELWAGDDLDPARMGPEHARAIAAQLIAAAEHVEATR